MKIAVLGASGRTGGLVVRQALERGWPTVAYVRRADALPAREGLEIVTGELSDAGRLRSALAGADAVICCLGTRQHKPPDLMRVSLPLIVQAMNRAGRARLVLLSAYGVGETARTASPEAQLVYKTVVASVFRDKELAEAELPASGLDWTGVYPVALTDGPLIEAVETRPLDEVTAVKGLSGVSRANVAKALLDAAADSRTVGRKLLVAGKGAAR